MLELNQPADNVHHFNGTENISPEMHQQGSSVNSRKQDESKAR